MSETELVVARHENAAWLPRGGRADVVLVRPDAAVPVPACVVRLLVVRGSALLVEQRPDGRGRDLPMLHVGDDPVADRLAALLARTLGGPLPATLLGYVRNVVPHAPEDYPWPSPRAHFLVWLCHLPCSPEPPGAWLDIAEAQAELGDRHWWPLTRHVPELT